MAVEQQELEAEQGDQILIGGELRPKNAFYIAVAETEARNKISGQQRVTLPPLIEIEGEPVSHTIIRDRGPY